MTPADAAYTAYVVISSLAAGFLGGLIGKRLRRRK